MTVFSDPAYADVHNEDATGAGGTGINRILPLLREPMTESEVLRLVNGQWKMPDCKYLKEIILYVNDEFRVFKRP